MKGDEDSITKRWIWFTLICGMTLALSVNPVFADSDQTADGEYEGISAANEVSSEYDSTAADEYTFCDTAEHDERESEDDIFEVTMDELLSCESCSETDCEDAGSDACNITDGEESGQSLDELSEASDDTLSDERIDTDDTY